MHNECDIGLVRSKHQLEELKNKVNEIEKTVSTASDAMGVLRGQVEASKPSLASSMPWMNTGSVPATDPWVA